jgi:DNA-binding NarL/FixJ family response regulator
VLFFPASHRTLKSLKGRTMSKLSVIVADDHHCVCEGLCSIISENKQIEVVGRAYSCASTLTLCQTHLPDILLLDVKMPGSEASEIVTQVRQLSPQTKIICLTGDDDPFAIQSLIGMGVDGYLFKHETCDTLTSAILSVGHGKPWFSQDVWSIWKRLQAASSPARKPAPTDPSFNERELKILRGLAEGKTNLQIGQVIGLSERSTGRELNKLKSKLAVKSKAELMAKAKQLGH